jgi:capsid protein
MGVEINKFGRPINYYILKVHPDDNFHSPATYEKDKYNGTPLVQRSGININNFDNVK